MERFMLVRILMRTSAPCLVLALGLVSCSESMEAPIGNPTFATVQGVWTADYRRVVTQEASPQVYDSRSIATCSATVPPPCAIRPFYFVLDSANQGQYAFASAPPSESTYSPLLLGTAAVANDSLILGPTLINCCLAAATYGLEVFASRMHLTRHWTIGAFDAQSLGFALPPGGSLQATEELWYHR
jgi:hypothetical protein